MMWWTMFLLIARRYRSINEQKGINMLVLTRKKNESIRIGNDIILTIIEATPNRVKIAFKAPLNVKIIRTELEDKPIERESHDEQD